MDFIYLYCPGEGCAGQNIHFWGKIWVWECVGVNLQNIQAIKHSEDDREEEGKRAQGSPCSLLPLQEHAGVAQQLPVSSHLGKILPTHELFSSSLQGLSLLLRVEEERRGGSLALLHEHLLLPPGSGQHLDL